MSKKITQSVSEISKLIKTNVLGYLFWFMALIGFTVFCDGIQFSNVFYRVVFLFLVFVISSSSYMIGKCAELYKNTKTIADVTITKIMNSIGCTEDEAIDCMDNPDRVEYYINKYNPEQAKSKYKELEDGD